MPIPLDLLTSGPQVALYGRPVTISRPGYAPVTLNGIFDRGYVEIGLGEQGGAGIEAKVAIRRTDLRIMGFGLRSEDAGVAAELNITIDGVRYRPIDAQPDSEGMMVFPLELAEGGCA